MRSLAGRPPAFGGIGPCFARETGPPSPLALSSARAEATASLLLFHSGCTQQPPTQRGSGSVWMVWSASWINGTGARYLVRRPPGGGDAVRHDRLDLPLDSDLDAFAGRLGEPVSEATREQPPLAWPCKRDAVFTTSPTAVKSCSDRLPMLPTNASPKSRPIPTWRNGPSALPCPSLARSSRAWSSMTRAGSAIRPKHRDVERHDLVTDQLVDQRPWEEDVLRTRVEAAQEHAHPAADRWFPRAP